MSRQNGHAPTPPERHIDVLRKPELVDHVKGELTLKKDGTLWMVDDETGRQRHMGHIDVITSDGKRWQLIIGPAPATERLSNQILELWKTQLKADGDL